MSVYSDRLLAQRFRYTGGVVAPLLDTVVRGALSSLVLPHCCTLCDLRLFNTHSTSLIADRPTLFTNHCSMHYHCTVQDNELELLLPLLRKLADKDDVRPTIQQTFKTHELISQAL
jgi:hypothetical protein